jgi:hypothetical protein
MMRSRRVGQNPIAAFLADEDAGLTNVKPSGYIAQKQFQNSKSKLATLTFCS